MSPVNIRYGQRPPPQPPPATGRFPMLQGPPPFGPARQILLCDEAGVIAADDVSGHSGETKLTFWRAPVGPWWVLVVNRFGAATIMAIDREGAILRGRYDVIAVKWSVSDGDPIHSVDVKPLGRPVYPEER